MSEELQHCIKCGQLVRHHFEWSGLLTIGGQIVNDRMRRWCSNCGYTYYEPCADAEAYGTS